jgi:hypothetical protein
LETLRTELQSILDPNHPLNESWYESESFDEWQAHIKTLCDTLSQAMRESDNGVFKELDSLRKKYETIDEKGHHIQAQMKVCFAELDWQNNKDTVLEIIRHLPQCYLRFTMYERYYALQDAEDKANAESVSPQEGGDGHA